MAGQFLTTLPLAEVSEAIQLLTSGQVTTKKANFAWDVLQIESYGCYFLLGQPGAAPVPVLTAPSPGAEAPAKFDLVQGLMYLRSHGTDHEKMKASATAFDWKTFFTNLLAELVKILSGL
jgi:hypothetical protein